MTLDGTHQKGSSGGDAGVTGTALSAVISWLASPIEMSLREVMARPTTTPAYSLPSASVIPWPLMMDLMSPTCFGDAPAPGFLMTGAGFAATSADPSNILTTCAEVNCGVAALSLIHI